jgi:membrane-associated phospholipid phosphatase
MAHAPPLRHRRAVVASAIVAFAVLALLVTTGASDGVDVAVRDALRPDDVWGRAQVRVDTIVEGLEPVRVLPVFVVAVLLLSWSRHSWRPVVHALALLAAAGLPAVVVKRTMARTDPHHDMSSLGSFPSGHVLVLLVCLGGLLLLVRPRPTWWQWALVALVDLVMGVALLVQAAHWLTDVVAGALLGVAALAATAALARGPSDPAPARTAGRAARPAPPRSVGPPP